MALVNDFYSYVYLYSRDTILKRFDKHEKKLAALVDISNASVEQPPNDSNIKVNDETISVLETILELIQTIRKILQEILKT
jgi:hypothetical protein